MTVTHDFTALGGRNTATSGNAGTHLEFDHTFGPAATALLVGTNAFPADIAAWSTGIGKSYSEFTRSVKIGDANVPLTLLDVRDLWPGHVDSYTAVWGIVGSDVVALRGTTQKIKIDEAYALDPSLHYPAIHGSSVSYNGAAAFNAAGFSANVHNATISIASDVGHMVFSAFGGSRWSSGSGIWRYYFTNLQSGGKYVALLLQDQPGAYPTATATASSIDHGAVSHCIVDIIPGDISDPPLIRTISLDPMTRGVPFNQTISVSGTEPIEFNVEGSLPNGITFDPDTKLLFGVPIVAGLFNFTLIADNEDGHDERDYTVNVGQINFPFDPKTRASVEWLAENGLWYSASIEVLHDDGIWRPTVLEC